MPVSATRWFAVVTCLAAMSSALPSTQQLSQDHQLVHDCTQAITAYDVITATALYQDIKQAGYLDDCAFKLAVSMKTALESAEFDVLDSKMKSEFESLIEELPISVKNAVFAAAVCFLNPSYNEYLFSPNDDYIHDADSRNLFLWRPGGQVPGANFTLVGTATDTDWKIVNVYGEYVYADDTHAVVNRRNTFTYTPAEWTGASTNVWRFKPAGDDVILQNTWYAGAAPTTEYLYAAANTYNFDNERRKPFTWDASWGTDFEHLWRIVAC